MSDPGYNNELERYDHPRDMMRASEVPVIVCLGGGNNENEERIRNLLQGALDSANQLGYDGEAHRLQESIRFLSTISDGSIMQKYNYLKDRDPQEFEAYKNRTRENQRRLNEWVGFYKGDRNTRAPEIDSGRFDYAAATDIGATRVRWL